MVDICTKAVNALWIYFGLGQSPMEEEKENQCGIWATQILLCADAMSTGPQNPWEWKEIAVTKNTLKRGCQNTATRLTYKWKKGSAKNV